MLLLLAEGLPNKAIVPRLGISRKTLDVHRSNILAKMRVDGVPGLIRLMWENGKALRLEPATSGVNESDGEANVFSRGN